MSDYIAMLKDYEAGRDEDAAQLRLVRRAAHRVALRLRRCCAHCKKYQLVSRVGNRPIIEGDIDEIQVWLAR